MGTLMNALSILDSVRGVPSAAVSFLEKFGCAISRACGKKERNRAVFPAVPYVKVWFLTLNLPSSGSHTIEISKNHSKGLKLRDQ